MYPYISTFSYQFLCSQFLFTQSLHDPQSFEMNSNTNSLHNESLAVEQAHDTPQLSISGSLDEVIERLKIIRQENLVPAESFDHATQRFNELMESSEKEIQLHKTKIEAETKKCKELEAEVAKQ